MADLVDDIRPRGTVEVACSAADCPWAFWVDALDPRLPTGPFFCVQHDPAGPPCGCRCWCRGCRTKNSGGHDGVIVDDPSEWPLCGSTRCRNPRRPS